MQPTLKALAAAGIALATLAGCMTQPAGPTDMVTAGAAMQGAFSATEPPSAADRAMTCPALASEVATLQARYDVMEAEQRAAQRRNGLVSGGINLGATLLGGSMMANAGSAQSIRTIGTGVNLARAGATAAATQSNGSEQLTSVNEAAFIARRIAQLQRVQFEKPCTA